MLFWDTSAIVAALLDESSSHDLLRLLAAHPTIVASAITPVEITSALWRRLHHGQISAPAHRQALDAFAALSRNWIAVADLESVTPIALDVLTRHALRAGDAIQLASAILIAGDIHAALPFVTLDRRLATAARSEGFTVVP